MQMKRAVRLDGNCYDPPWMKSTKLRECGCRRSATVKAFGGTSSGEEPAGWRGPGDDPAFPLVWGQVIVPASALTLKLSNAIQTFAGNADTMGMMDRDCAVCHQPIQDQEQWFRVYEEYVHLSCAEKYLRLVSGRRHQAKTAPAKA